MRLGRVNFVMVAMEGGIGWESVRLTFNEAITQPSFKAAVSARLRLRQISVPVTHEGIFGLWSVSCIPTRGGDTRIPWSVMSPNIVRVTTRRSASI